MPPTMQATGGGWQTRRSLRWFSGVKQTPLRKAREKYSDWLLVSGVLVTSGLVPGELSVVAWCSCA